MASLLPDQKFFKSSFLNRKSGAASFWRPASVVRDGRDVADRGTIESCSSQSADGRFARRAGAAHAHVNAAHAVVARQVGGIDRCLLSRKRSAFARSAEAERTRALPGNHAPFAIGDGHPGVIERGLGVTNPVRNVLALLLLELLFLALLLRCGRAGRCCYWFCHVSIS